VLDPKGLCAALLRDFYIAEVFLSLDVADDAQQFLESETLMADSDVGRLSHSIVLSQLLLIQSKHNAYANLLTDRLLPSAIKVSNARGNLNRKSVDVFLSEGVLVLAAGMAMMPVFSTEFLKTLERDQLLAMTDDWQQQRGDKDDEVHVLAIDLFLEAAFTRLKDAQQREAATARLKENSKQKTYPDSQQIMEIVKAFRESQKAVHKEATPQSTE